VKTRFRYSRYWNNAHAGSQFSSSNISPPFQNPIIKD
jgi:hypothetical protein